jgi:hypothetical protein
MFVRARRSSRPLPTSLRIRSCSFGSGAPKMCVHMSRHEGRSTVNTTINDLSYAEMVDMLDAELTAVAAILKGLSDEEWGRTSPLRPVEETLPHWTVREIASHFDISIGLTLALIEGQEDVQPARDRTSFLHQPAKRDRAGRLRVRLPQPGRLRTGPGPRTGRADVRADDQPVPHNGAGARRTRLLRPDEARRVRREPHCRSGRARDRRHPGARQIAGRRAGCCRLHRRHPGRPARPTYRRDTASGPGRRPRVGARRFGTCRPCRQPAALDRLRRRER